MKQYHELLELIKTKGTCKEPAREGMPSTTSLFGHQMRFDLSEGFPLVTTKKVNFNHIVVELLWFLKGDTNIKFLVDRNCNIWNEDAYKFYIKKANEICELYGSEPPCDLIYEDIEKSELRLFTFQEFIEVLKNTPCEKLMKEVDYTFGDCGSIYGHLWRNWEANKIDWNEGAYMPAEVQPGSVDQLKDLLVGLKNNPLSRRHIIAAWNPNTLDNMALNACHSFVQFNCRPIPFEIKLQLAKNNINIDFENLAITEAASGNTAYGFVQQYYLDCQLYQRSGDAFLGVPYNIASYALLTEIISELCNMIPGDFVHTFGDVHIYENHINQVNEQLARDYKELPKLNINTEFWIKNQDTGQIDIGGFLEGLKNNNFINCLIQEDIQLINYNPHPVIKAKLSTGLK